MDANGLRFWMIADENHWRRGDDSHLSYDREHRSLRLASERPPVELDHPPDFESKAIDSLELTPQAIDDYGNRAYWDAQGGLVMAAGTLPEAVPIYKPAPGEKVTDLAMGFDGVLYMAIEGRIHMLDRRGRWDPVEVDGGGFIAWRLAPHVDGGVWALDREGRSVARVAGLPLPARPYAPYNPDVFRPANENPTPPRLSVASKATWPLDETPVAIACGPRGRLTLLTWTVEDANVRVLDEAGEFGPAIALKDARRPFSMAWVDDDRLALILSNLANEALVYSITEGAKQLSPTGDLYPLRDHDGGPFLKGTQLPPHFPTAAGSGATHRLSLPSYARAGGATNASIFDSGSSQTVWHRLYLEASIPPNCGARIYLAATDDAAAPGEGESVWHEHQFGEVFANADPDGVPRGAWVPFPSELPFHEGLLGCDRLKGRSGLFTALIQRPGRRVRTLRGRYIWVRLELSGDGHATPEVAAVRIYASRFSYLNRYLPRLYRESLYGAEADEVAPPGETVRATQADFLERFLDNFEGMFTLLEDRIANSYLLTDARTAPEQALEWLGSWIGVGFDPAYPAKQRRRLIESAPELYRWRGTLHGLRLALDVATAGAYSGGEIVVVEDFRLRRTFATILGVDFTDEDDPLLGGISASGNSFVGDTLFLGDENKREFLALFDADLKKSAAEDAAIASLFDRLAHRVTVLVHQEVEPQDLGLIRRIVEMETPAHVISRVEKASASFMVGIASLVGVDTYLAKHKPPPPLRVDRSQIGVRGTLEHAPSLDPRFEGGDAPALV